MATTLVEQFGWRNNFVDTSMKIAMNRLKD